MNEPRVIKKYPNRRLYDTVESRYITLSDVRKLVVERVEFVVIDKKSQEDITRCILLQVIAELEQAADPLMSRDFLSQIICSHDANAHDMIGSYLEQSFKLFSAHQRDARERANDAVQVVATLAQKNYQRWRAVQDEIYRTLLNAANGSSGEARPAP
jgi:polyhydroxyalkanoate synthesis repressor PhaR